MTNESREANRIVLAVSHRFPRTRADLLAARRKRDKEGGGALQPVDRPKAGSGGAAAELETV